MNNTNQFLYQFAEDYGQNEEMKNLAFIKLAAAIQGHISSLEPAILEIISGDNDIVRHNVIYFIKLVTCLDYFDFKSGFIDKVFQMLVHFAKNNIHSDQFQIVCLMLIRKEIQQKYLAFLMQLISENQQDEVNFSLCVLEQLLYDVLEIMEGRKKGPKISSQMINDLCEKSFKQLRRNLSFYNIIDKQNFFLICQHSLSLIRKFYTEKKISDLKIYENIWNHGVFNCQNEDPKVINPIFGIMVQLCNFRENYIRNIENSQNFNQIIRCSQIFILKCEQINKFWSAYLTKRKNLLLEPINNLDSVAIAMLFSDCFYHLTQSIEQIQSKLTIVDNYILLNEVTVKMKSIEHISNLRKQLNLNPEMKGVQQVMLDSFQALYTPIYKIKQKSSFFQVVLEIKNITRYILNNPQVNRLRACKKFLNILPSLKIIFIKCRDVVTKEECIETLVQFLFLFLSIDNPKCFQNLINIICDQFLKQIQQIKAEQTEKMRIFIARVDKIIYSSIGMLQTEGICKKNISSYVKCINSLIKIIFRKQSIQINSYIQKLLKIVELRNAFYDEQLHKLISFLIKSMPKTQNAINTFQCLRRVIIDNSNLPYLQLMFDFAETHYTNPQIMQSMAFCNNKIAEMCFICPMAQSLLRNISYNVMIQSVRGNLDTFKSVIQGISYITKQPSFKPKVYKRLIEIIMNQREKLEMFVREQKNLLLKVGEIIIVLVQMIRKIVTTLEENNQATKAQKSEICEEIAFEIFNLCKIFYKEFKNSSVEVYGLISQIKGVLNSQSLKDLPNILRTIKLLMTSHTLLQTQSVVPSGDQNYMEFYKSIKILKETGIPKKQLKIQDHLFLMSTCNKFMGAKLVNQAGNNRHI